MVISGKQNQRNKTMDIDLFNTSKISDIPFIVRTHTTTQKILDLFDKKKQLTTAEIRVAYYRLYKKELSANYVRSILKNNLNKKLRREGHTYYKI